MSREWRLNPPPNWPLTAGVEVGLDWRPDPAWGPPPVGWPLWQRQRVRSGRFFLPAVFGLAVGAASLVGALVGEAVSSPAPPVIQRSALNGADFLPTGLVGGTAAGCPASDPGAGQLSVRWVAGGVRPTDC